jgi:hypothetical protein
MVRAVLASRDAIDPDLDTDLLEAIVNAEADAAGDGDAGLRSIESAVNTALARGVGRVDGVVGASADDDSSGPTG